MPGSPHPPTVPLRRPNQEPHQWSGRLPASCSFTRAAAAFPYIFHDVPSLVFCSLDLVCLWIDP